jgi:hypothetical protein
MNSKTGKITPNGVILETHENATIVYLTEKGFNIELIPTSQIEGIHTPDFKMCGLDWVMKSPCGHSRWTIENQLRRAVRQSQNIVLDGRRLKMPNQQIEREITRQFEKFKSIKRLILINKHGEMLSNK